MKIIIYSQNLVSMDGVGNSSLYFKNILEKFLNVELIAHHSNIEGVKSFHDYLKIHDPKNILLYHYSIFDINIKSLLELNFRKRIIYYHGITSPKFFPKGSELYNNCKQGLADINLLDGFDLYISNSSESKLQFLENLNKKNIENLHIIMPPTKLFKRKEEKLNIKKKSSNLDFYYCGTLSKHKNVYSLLEIFNKWNKNHLRLSVFTSFTKDDTLVYLGENKYIEFQDKGIRFFHRLNDLEMSKLKTSMDCFITFSMHEGFCIPLFNSIENLSPTISYPLKCLEDYFPVDYKFLDKNDSLENIQEKYYSNLEEIRKTKNFIKDKCLSYTETGTKLIFKTIDL